MALENDDLIVVQKSGGGELRKAKISDIKPDVAELWTEDSGKLYPTTLTNNVQVGSDIFMNADVGYVNSLGFNAGNGKALIKGDTGSAEFSSIVNVGNTNVSGEPDIGGAYVNSTGAIVAKRPTNVASSNPVFVGYYGNTKNVEIGADGSATFAGNITLNPSGDGIFEGGLLANYVRSKRNLDSDQIPAFYAIDTNSGSGKNIFHVGSSGINLGTDMTYGGGSVTNYNTRIGLDGSATFAGNVGIGTDTPTNGKLVIGGTPSEGIPAINVEPYSANFANTSDITLSANSVISAGSSINFNAVNGAITFNGGGGIRTGLSGTSEKMRIDSSGNVGIGTDAPSGKLDVQNGANRAIKFEVDGTSGDNHIKSYQGSGENVRNLRITGQEIAIDTNSSGESQGVNRIKVLTDGKVGIGTDAPSSDLQVGTYGSSGVRFYKTGYTQVRDDNGSGGFECYKDGSGSANRTVRITTAGNGYFSGNVGIGTDAPAQKLHVNGILQVDNQIRAWSNSETCRFKTQRTSGDFFTLWNGATSVGNGTKIAGINAAGKITVKDYDLEALDPLP